ncbi:MAG: 23S rRNA (adenine(1618)-N(6))-methyltransferase RlmF [Aureispira sp.]|nr:23S rRNA (adenine(1618)-N(6))-methyltransferase RlmF [Aureispira sp.]
MQHKKKKHPKVKYRLHKRNRHRERYDFKELIKTCPELAQFVVLNKYDDESIDFFNPEAVKQLNRALLMHYYDLEYWDIPESYLCPPIPGRADYIHHIADILSGNNYGKVPTGASIKCLDIGIGANCVYPIIGNKEYGWSFIGSDIDSTAIESATKIVESNPSLKGQIALKLQEKSTNIFRGILEEGEQIDLSICNPPFHPSQEAARAAAIRKVSNLKQTKIEDPTLNFGGQSNELWCDGGEKKFIKTMIHRSKNIGKSCFWFSTLVSKQSHLLTIYKLLKAEKAVEVKTISMGQGNKSSRIVAWTFLKPKQQTKWAAQKWRNEFKEDKPTGTNE